MKSPLNLRKEMPRGFFIDKELVMETCAIWSRNQPQIREDRIEICVCKEVKEVSWETNILWPTTNPKEGVFMDTSRVILLLKQDKRSVWNIR